MSNQLIIKNIPNSVSNEVLAQRVQEVGNIRSVKILTDNVTFQSKGEAIVEIEVGEDLQKFQTELNGIDLNGQNLIVSLAQ